MAKIRAYMYTRRRISDFPYRVFPPVVILGKGDKLEDLRSGKLSGNRQPCCMFRTSVNCSGDPYDSTTIRIVCPRITVRLTCFSGHASGAYSHLPSGATRNTSGSYSPRDGPAHLMATRSFKSSRATRSYCLQRPDASQSTKHAGSLVVIVAPSTHRSPSPFSHGHPPSGAMAVPGIGNGPVPLGTNPEG